MGPALSQGRQQAGGREVHGTPHRMMINKRAGQRRGDRETVAGQSGRKAPQERLEGRGSWEQPGGQRQQGRRPRPAAGDQGRCVPQPRAEEAGQGDGVCAGLLRVHRGLSVAPRDSPKVGLCLLRAPGQGCSPQTPRHSPLALDTRRAAPRVTPCPPTQHLATFIMDKSEAITSVEDAIRKLVQLSSKEKIWTQEMLLQVDGQSLRLLDMESQVPRREEGAGWSCQAGGGSDPAVLGLSTGPEGGGQRAGGPGGAGVRGATPHRPTPPSPEPSRAGPRRARGVDLAVPAASVRRPLLGRVWREGHRPGQSARVRGAPSLSPPPGAAPSLLSPRRSWRTSLCPACGTARRCSTSCATRPCCCSCARTRTRASPTSTSSTATRWR